MLMIIFRVNDITVPYVTAAIESQDVFAESATNGIEMCVSFLV